MYLSIKVLLELLQKIPSGFLIEPEFIRNEISLIKTNDSIEKREKKKYDYE